MLKLFLRTIILPFGLIIFSVGCNDGAEGGESKCDTASILDFDEFLGVQYGDEEKLLRAKLGNFTKGFYTPDSLHFVYEFNRVDRVPVSVWVNPNSMMVNTVFMEVLSLGETFDNDLQAAVEEFKMNTCESKWFGRSPTEIKQLLGTPAEEATDDQGVLLLSYDSPDFLYTVAFKFYPQQAHKCSSVSVNWFYG